MTRSGTPPDLDALLAPLPDEEAERLREMWHLTPDAPPGADALPSPDEAWASMDAALSARPAPRDRAPVRLAPRRRWRWAAAAVLPLLAVALGLWLLRPDVTLAPPGDPTPLTLADGTAVQLRAGSRLAEVPRLFGGARLVRLTGEAAFDVTTDGSRFVVETEQARVEVLGTRFTVRAWPEEEETTIALLEGRVRLESLHDAAEAEVVPGEVWRVRRSLDRTTADVDAASAWREGAFVYKDRPLREILADVSRRYGVEIVAPASLRGRQVSVSLRHPESAEAVLNDLALALGFRYRARSDGFEILPLR